MNVLDLTVEPICRVGTDWWGLDRPDENRWQLPDGATNLCLFAGERGGAEHGFAIVISNGRGIRLTPFKAVTWDWLAERGEHMRFSVPGTEDRPLVTVQATRPDEETVIIVISRFTLVVPDGGPLVQIRREEIWTGNSTQVPNKVNSYSAAVAAASQKVRCRGCDGPHFASSTRRCSHRQ